MTKREEMVQEIKDNESYIASFKFEIEAAEKRTKDLKELLKELPPPWPPVKGQNYFTVDNGDVFEFRYISGKMHSFDFPTLEMAEKYNKESVLLADRIKEAFQ